MSKEIRRPKPDKKRLRRTMMFMNAQKPGLIKDAYIYGTDSIILDLEDAVAENQKDAARFSLYHALKSIDYGDTEVIVRINGLDTPHWQEDIRVCVAGGADGIRIAKCESAEMVHTVDAAVTAAEKEFGVEEGRTLLMAALESPLGIMNAYEIVTASPRMFGCAISGGDFRKSMHVQIQRDGVEMMVARGQMLLAARAAGVQCFDTMYPNIDDMEGFKAEVIQNHKMGFANHDAHFADHTVIITDTLVPFPNLPSSISCIDVDAVCVVDAIGDPKKIATKEARMTDNPRELMMAENVANVIAATPYFKDGFSFQTGVGGPSLAVNRFLAEHMKKAGIKMSFALGGTSSAICALQDKGLVDYILDTQDFDQGAAGSPVLQPPPH